MTYLNPWKRTGRFATFHNGWIDFEQNTHTQFSGLELHVLSTLGRKTLLHEQKSRRTACSPCSNHLSLIHNDSKAGPLTDPQPRQGWSHLFLIQEKTPLERRHPPSQK